MRLQIISEALRDKINDSNGRGFFCCCKYVNVSFRKIFCYCSYSIRMLLALTILDFEIL